MPRQVTTTVYQYDELSDKAKAKARDEWRRLEAESGDISWSKLTEKTFKEAAAHMGWNITDVAWSGFASQGDGAQFVGGWNAARVDVAALKKSWPLTNAEGERIADSESLHQFAARYAEFAAAHPQGSATVVHRAGERYSHSNANEFEVFDIADSRLAEFATLSRELMDLFYRMLEQEYGYQNSDEAVTESIQANENEFTEDGKFA